MATALLVSSYGGRLAWTGRLPSPPASAITFNSPSAGLEWVSDSGSGSSFSKAESSMSVVSVPLDDGAIGDGSAISLELEASGEKDDGGCR